MTVELSGMKYWFHESVSCLHDCIAMVLLHCGQEPIAVLGARWCFFHDRQKVSSEEFYYPSRNTEQLGQALAPFHALRARWRLAASSDELLEGVCHSLDDGRPALVVEDNFFMPNRPAFRDVHAAHLVLVTGYDRDNNTFRIMEPTPPLYHGAISREQLRAAVGSDNEVRPGLRDFFFAGSRIEFRWIDVEKFRAVPAIDTERLISILQRNLADLSTVSTTGQLIGISGLEAYLRDLVSNPGESDESAKLSLAEIYTVGWAHQAQTALHAEFLKQSGMVLRSPFLLEAARRVDSIAAQWTAFRLFGAHGAHGGLSLAMALLEIEDRIEGFISSHRRALAAIDRAITSIQT
ncbi:BtrH N-terminal domain-containing protein [Consotaella aegiceratis]|uniref:BtrH N-terminal domain-containing protein n=1 Tax=Consotaella aegiceratis TaxID=3097961 RepID=UPI002F41801C